MRYILLALLLSACDSGKTTTDAAGDPPDEPEIPVDVPVEAPYEVEWPPPPWVPCPADDPPPESSTVTVFTLADQYHAAESLRTIEADVDFPAGSWQAIAMKIDLTCPADGDCDNWDRYASISLLDSGTEIELERYITPYDVGMCILTDVSRFAPLLQGTRTIRSFISTWVGPTEPVHGHGWRISLSFIFHPGPPTDLPSRFVQVWPNTSVVVGDPSNPIADQMPAATHPIPASATRAELRLIATGHGQGNLFNCAEFCNLAHHISVDGSDLSHDPWRADCSLNPLGPLQAGTWQYPRSGWCPGAHVTPHVFDITSLVTPGEDATFAYDVLSSSSESYTNTCRPGAGDTTNTCTGCAFDSSPGNCDYDGGMHTEPVEIVTAQLLIYE